MRYKEQAEAGPDGMPGAGPEPGPQAAADDDNVVDAEFTEEKKD